MKSEGRSGQLKIREKRKTKKRGLITIYIK